MLRKIRLYGQLAKFVGQRVLEADVATAAEAVRFLLANWPELERHMAEGWYRVQVDREDLPLDTDPDHLHYPAGRSDVRIIPVVAGAGAAGRIIAGVALLTAAFAIPGFQAWAGPTAFSLIVGVGASLALGGVAQLLTPVPKADKDEKDPRKSFSFSGIQNTARQATPVPILYGEILTGSVVISAGVDIVRVKA